MNNKNEHLYYRLIGSVGMVVIATIGAFYVSELTSRSVGVAIYAIAFIVTGFSVINVILIINSFTKVDKIQSFKEESNAAINSDQEFKNSAGEEVDGILELMREARREQEVTDKILSDPQLTSYVIEGIVKTNPSLIQSLLDRYNDSHLDKEAGLEE